MWLFKELNARLYGDTGTTYETERLRDPLGELADYETPAYNSGKDYGVLGVAVPGVTVH